MLKSQIFRGLAIVNLLIYIAIFFATLKFAHISTILTFTMAISAMFVLFSPGMLVVKERWVRIVGFSIAPIASIILASFAIMSNATQETVAAAMSKISVYAIKGIIAILVILLIIALIRGAAVWVVWGEDEKLMLAITKQNNVKRFNRIEHISEKLPENATHQELVDMFKKYKPIVENELMDRWYWLR